MIKSEKAHYKNKVLSAKWFVKKKGGSTIFIQSVQIFKTWPFNSKQISSGFYKNSFKFHKKKILDQQIFVNLVIQSLG